MSSAESSALSSGVNFVRSRSTLASTPQSLQHRRQPSSASATSASRAVLLTPLKLPLSKKLLARAGPRCVGDDEIRSARDVDGAVRISRRSGGVNDSIHGRSRCQRRGRRTAQSVARDVHGILTRSCRSARFSSPAESVFHRYGARERGAHCSDTGDRIGRRRNDHPADCSQAADWARRRSGAGRTATTSAGTQCHTHYARDQGSIQMLDFEHHRQSSPSGFSVRDFGED